MVLPVHTLMLQASSGYKYCTRRVQRPRTACWHTGTILPVQTLTTQVRSRYRYYTRPGVSNVLERPVGSSSFTKPVGTFMTQACSGYRYCTRCTQHPRLFVCSSGMPRAVNTSTTQARSHNPTTTYRPITHYNKYWFLIAVS